MEYGAIFIIIALAAFMGSYLGNKASAPKAAAVCNNDTIPLPPPPPPKAATYEFEYESFTLDIKTNDGLSLDDFDRKATQVRFEAFAEWEEQRNNNDWKIFISISRQRNGLFCGYYQATRNNVDIAANLNNYISVGAAIKDSLLDIFKEIKKFRDNNKGNDDNDNITPNDPLGSAVDKLFE